MQVFSRTRSYNLCPQCGSDVKGAADTHKKFEDFAADNTDDQSDRDFLLTQAEPRYKPEGRRGPDEEAPK